jgi:nucleotide-binding universal stress UspA family protein
MTTRTLQKILVTTDLSVDATKAYPHARALAEALGATITVLCCIDTSIQFGMGTTFDVPVMYVPEALSAIKERTVTDLKKQVQEHFSGLPVQDVVLEAPSAAHHTIVDFIKNNQIDLTIIASHGRSGVARAFLGSIAEQVLRHSPKPVLIVPVKE